MTTLIKTHEHTLITVAIVLATSLLGYGLYGAIGMSMFWFGREHSQAEYRYMKLKGITREKLSNADGFRLEAWNYDSFINDLVFPIVVGGLIVGGSYVIKGVLEHQEVIYGLMQDIILISLVLTKL